MILGEAVTLLAAGDRPPGLLPTREEMAVSLGFHIILSSFGVAFPAMIFVMHRRGIVADDPIALRLAKRWSKVAAVLFAIGAVSGTILSFEMGLLWPGLMGRFGDLLGLPGLHLHADRVHRRPVQPDRGQTVGHLQIDKFSHWGPLPDRRASRRPRHT